MDDNEKPRSFFSPKYISVFAAGFFLFVMFLNALVGKANVTGYVGGVPMDAQNLDLSVEGNKVFKVSGGGEDLTLRMLRLSGKVIGTGDVQVYLRGMDGERILLYTNRLAGSMASITGFAAAKQGIIIDDGDIGVDLGKKTEITQGSSGSSTGSSDAVGEFSVDPFDSEDIYDMIDVEILEGAGITKKDGVLWLVDKAAEKIDVGLTFDDDERAAKKAQYDAEGDLEEEAYLLDKDKVYSDKLSFEEIDVYDDIVDGETMPVEPLVPDVEPSDSPEDSITGHSVTDPPEQEFVPIDRSVQYVFKNSCAETCTLDAGEFDDGEYMLEFEVEPGTKIEVSELLYVEG